MHHDTSLSTLPATVTRQYLKSRDKQGAVIRQASQLPQDMLTLYLHGQACTTVQESLFNMFCALKCSRGDVPKDAIKEQVLLKRMSYLPRQ